MFFLKSKENSIFQSIKALHSKVTGIVNALSSIAGLPSLKYSQISVDSLKFLKLEGFSEKVSRISDYDQALEAMKVRLHELKLKR